MVLSEDIFAKGGIHWSLEVSGKFSEENHDEDWKKIWSVLVKNRVRDFVWLIKHDRTWCSVERRRRGITTNECCYCYTNILEGIEHIFQRCSRAMEV